MAKLGNNEVVNGWTHKFVVGVDDIVRRRNAVTLRSAVIPILTMTVTQQLRNLALVVTKPFADIVPQVVADTTRTDITFDHELEGTTGVVNFPDSGTSLDGRPVFFEIIDEGVTLAAPLVAGETYWLKQKGDGDYEIYIESSLATAVQLTDSGDGTTGDYAATLFNKNVEIAAFVGDGVDNDGLITGTSVLGATPIVKYADGPFLVGEDRVKLTSYPDVGGEDIEGAIELSVSANVGGNLAYLGSGEITLLLAIDDVAALI
jgi:hypothetical protein